MVAQSSLYRQEAARLAAQALLIKATLSTHREGPERAIGYAKQAVIYSKESADIALQLIILRRLAWIYFCDKQLARAAETALQAQDLLEHTKMPLPLLIHSAVYAGVAKYQAPNGHEENASQAFHQASDTFPDQPNDDGDSGIIEFDRSGLFNDGGLTYYYLERYDEAFNLLAQVVDPETLASKMPVVSERNHVQVINYQTLVSLKRPQKDMDLSIKLWTAGIQGARALHSKQRYNEALEAFGIMQALWSGDRRIKELRDLVQHW
jgi:tetratricopeptide (TPR) repeat protein